MLPESPRWLVQRGQAAAAKKVLSSVIRSPERVDAEMEEMSRSVSQGLPPHVAFVRLWSTPPLRRASQLGIGFMAVQQLAGINTIMFYSGMLMQRGTGFDTSVTEWLTALCCFAQLLGVCVSLYSIDRDGRRVTALRSAFGVTTALLLIACYSLHTTSAGEIAFNKLMVNNSFAPILVVLIMVYLCALALISQPRCPATLLWFPTLICCAGSALAPACRRFLGSWCPRSIQWTCGRPVWRRRREKERTLHAK